MSVVAVVVVQSAGTTVLLSLAELVDAPVSNRPPKARKVHFGAADHVIMLPNASVADAVTPPNPAGTVAYFTVSKVGIAFAVVL